MTQMKTKTISCDWCKSENCRDTGGIEWSGHAIYVCNQCSHEWVETSVKKQESKFLAGLDQMVEDLNKGKL